MASSIYLFLAVSSVHWHNNGQGRPVVQFCSLSTIQISTTFYIIPKRNKCLEGQSVVTIALLKSIFQGQHFLRLEKDSRINSRERGHKISEADLNSWFEGNNEEREQMMTDEEIWEEVLQEEEGLTEMLEPPTTTQEIKSDTAFNCFNTCITWAEENGWPPTRWARVEPAPPSHPCPRCYVGGTAAGRAVACTGGSAALGAVALARLARETNMSKDHSISKILLFSVSLELMVGLLVQCILNLSPANNESTEVVIRYQSTNTIKRARPVHCSGTNTVKRDGNLKLVNPTWKSIPKAPGQDLSPDLRVTEHDDRAPPPTRRVSFKPSSNRVVKQSRRDWELAIRSRLEDGDIDMNGAGFSGNNPYISRGSKSHQQRGGRGRNSPLPNMRRTLQTGPSNWFRVIIPHGHKYSKEYILKTLQNYIAPQPFIPVAYQIQGTESFFFVDSLSTAEELMNADKKITTKDGFRSMLYSMAEDSGYVSGGGGGKLIVKVRPGYPHVEVDDKLKERIKLVMGKRYNAATKALDLTKFHMDEAENIPELVGLNLTENKLYSLEPLTSLVKKAPNLTVLHIGKNRIHEVIFVCKQLRELRQLEYLQGLRLEDLVLDGNPLCDKFREQSTYVRRNSHQTLFTIFFFMFIKCSEVRKRFPKVIKLDGINLPPPIGFDVLDNAKLPPSKGSFIVVPEGQFMARQFLEQYYQLYDSDNRQGLIDAYHDNAIVFQRGCNNFFYITIFVVGLFFVFSQVNDDSRLINYISESRNLVRINDFTRRQKLLHVGKQNIISCLSQFPKTQHDPMSFQVDLVLFTPQLIMLCVTGLFREPEQKTPPIRSFMRTFVIVPVGSGFCIINEELFITCATTEQLESAFNTPLPAQTAPTPVSPPSQPQGGPVLDDATKQQMVEVLAQQTGMNLSWSKKCLDETNWDFQKAVFVFSELHKQGTVPPEAFIK
uniref:Nuclear RNA export factor 1 n=1 Tax=Timema monikensis TaxID=170555 RepID=A0A7R9HI13_9NEOP|nr:unnamed protein product [Timema monikensis]